MVAVEHKSLDGEISFVQVNYSTEKEFEESISIYLSSFPAGERQPLERIKKRVDDKICNLYCLKTNNVVIGMALLWTFDKTKFMLLDYLAIDKKFRGLQYGKSFMRYLSRIAEEEKKIIAIEVEHPDYGDDKEKRISRISFYVKNGAKILENVRYAMPSLADKSNIEMLLLIQTNEETGKRLISSEIKELIEIIYRKVYLLDKQNALFVEITKGVPLFIKLSESYDY